MVRVLLDASFIISSVRAGVDIMEGVRSIAGSAELALPIVVFEEVQRNGSQLCAQMLERLHPKLLVAQSILGDDALLEVSRKGDILATLDKDLKVRAREKELRIITLRQNKYVVEV